MTILRQTSPHSAVIQHSLGQTTYYLTLKWEGEEATVTGPAEGTHRYFLRMNSKKTTTSRSLRLTATFSPEPLDATTSATTTTTSFPKLLTKTKTWWNTYWTTGAFVNLSRVIKSKSKSKSSSSSTSKNITASRNRTPTPHPPLPLPPSRKPRLLPPPARIRPSQQRLVRQIPPRNGPLEHLALVVLGKGVSRRYLSRAILPQM
ncbi:hypothetical protein B0H65DRAFT_203037 [Neurospora tetraspora]|uniref:Uncharacterized protein n=1 Tax=Neurospora tetraspora TaxID=94610 RepID=A0AAE0JFV6_9PEZI|nr:hypothetical protein B0H65DRAFT_203037 [Neurospora tetraspora]